MKAIGEFGWRWPCSLFRELPEDLNVNSFAYMLCLVGRDLCVAVSTAIVRMYDVCMYVDEVMHISGDCHVCIYLGIFSWESPAGFAWCQWCICNAVCLDVSDGAAPFPLGWDVNLLLLQDNMIMCNGCHREWLMLVIC